MTRETRIWDIAATAAKLLELEIPASWVASPVQEVWGPLEFPEVAPLEVQTSEALTLIYNDEGTGSFANVSIWRPGVPEGFRSLGDVPFDAYTSPMVTSYVVAADHPAVTQPMGYEKIWSDAGANGDLQVTLWNPIPALGSVCPGQIATADYGAPPELDAIACVRADHAQVAGVAFVWDDTGSGADWDGSIWGCTTPPNGVLVHPTFLSRRHHDGPGYVECMGLSQDLTTLRDG